MSDILGFWLCIMDLMVDINVIPARLISIHRHKKNWLRLRICKHKQDELVGI